MRIFRKLKVIIFIVLILELISAYKYFSKHNITKDNYPYLKESTETVINQNPKYNGKLTFPQGTLIINGKYINEIVKGNKEIYNKTMQITSNCKTDEEKAKAIYVWIAKNINYNYAYEKEINSGITVPGYGDAIDTFNKKSGVCVGFAALYFVMARDVGLDVRMVGGKGLGGSGNEWGGHEWNEVYIKSLDKWINVDCTFANAYTEEVKRGGLEFEPKGILSDEPSYKVVKYRNDEIITMTVHTANFFDSKNFNATHKDGTVNAQWIYY